MKAVKQEFQATVEGDVAGRDIINEAPRTSIQIGAINGGQNIIGQTGDIHLQVSARPRIKVVIQPPTPSRPRTGSSSSSASMTCSARTLTLLLSLWRSPTSTCWTG